MSTPQALTPEERKTLLGRLADLEKKRQQLVALTEEQGTFASGLADRGISPTTVRDQVEGTSNLQAKQRLEILTQGANATKMGSDSISSGADALAKGGVADDLLKKYGIRLQDLVDAGKKGGSNLLQLVEAKVPTAQAGAVLELASKALKAELEAETLNANVLKARSEAEGARADLANRHLVEQISLDYANRSGGSNLAKLRDFSVDGNTSFGNLLSAAGMGRGGGPSM
jgi:hypothetical protein